MMPSIRAAALSDIGRVRRENEDRFVLDHERLVFGVADGVGGLPGGAEAAQLAIDEIATALDPVPLNREPDLPLIVQQANRAVAMLGQRISPSLGIGTTLTLGCMRAKTFAIAHVGDSRAYLGRMGQFIRLTEDHSVENEARIRRARGEVIYYHEANRHALTRCIGQPTPPDVDLIVQPLQAGDRYLFCTDGVTRMIPDPELANLLAKHDDPNAMLEEVIGLAVRRGGPDNATAVAIFVDSP